MKIEVKHVALAAPHVKDWELPGALGNGPPDTLKTKGGAVGIGVVAELENTSNVILMPPVIELTAELTGTHGTRSCSGPASLVASWAPGPRKAGEPAGAAKAEWRDEQALENEKYWRPGERLRALVRVACGPALLLDLDLTEITLTVAATAGSALANAPAESAPRAKRRGRAAAEAAAPAEVADVHGAETQVKLPGRALTGQLVKLPSGDPVIAVGSSALQLGKAAPTLVDLSRLGVSLHAAETQSLPDALPDVTAEGEGLKVHLTDAKLVSFADDPSIPKGSRRLDTTWDLAFSGADGTGKPPFACDKVRLVTTRGLVVPSNAKQAEEACKALAGGKAAPTIAFLLERYDVPLALAFKVGKADVVKLVGTTALSRFDPR